MRPIDADALREHWHISEKCEECHWNNRDCSKPPYYSLHDICEAIDDAPTIDAIPVEWLKQWRDKLKGMGEYQQERAEDISFVLGLWEKEQGAQDGRISRSDAAMATDVQVNANEKYVMQGRLPIRA